MRFTKVGMQGLVFAGLFAFGANAIPDQNKQVLADVEDIEVIEVTGDRPLSYFRQLYHQAENDFYKMFNELSSEDDFKVVCEDQRIHSFTNLKKRKCAANFVDRVAYEESQRAFNMTSLRSQYGSGLIEGGVPVALRNKKRLLALRKKQIEHMKQTLLESPELMQKYAALVKAKQEFESRRSQ